MRHALIIGAGIAGPAAALALRRAGIRSTVYESHSTSAESVGGFLTVAVNGRNALRALDCADCLREGFPTPRMSIYSGTGKRLAAFDYGPTLADGDSCRTMNRTDLYAALRATALARDIEIVHGKRLVEVEPRRAGVRAVFADGSAADGDLLIGADGLRSRTRMLIDPAAPPARYTGLLNTGGYAHGAKVDAPVGEMTFVFGRRAFFGYVRHPDDAVWWFTNFGAAAEPRPDELAAMDVRARLNDLFAGDNSPALDLIAHTEQLIAPFGTYDFPSVPTWYRDGMIIIGDAAHAASPASGQGASMALEDAVVLGKALRDEASVESAFASYERQRRARVEHVVAWGKKRGDRKAPGYLGRLLRDHVIFPLFVARGAGATDPNAWMYEFPAEWDADPVREAQL
ncbi:FAD-dependent oxidoreductase [Nocardia arthritidis]|uniref:NAD(P)-binding protein n=1 Tax=Nocardia arthritidis TaxID=228602 RepID=A0A6G9YLC6_9NOCA|nr:FAD-dependent monooxygenase [Nocardia arthritidis]QIS13826.1 NAD(P)-binding protein [Nocardia arthritidis]